MTDRWSNPSGTIGVERFGVWPAGTDSYNHTQNAANWDMVDDILGQPSDASQWPPDLGLDKGIYKQIQLLILERTPIGTIAPFFRPSLSVPIPTGWAACDGSTLTSGEHNFPGIGGSVTLPDLRNAFVLGADATFALGQAAAAVTSGNINTNAGAPGGNAVGGDNQIIQTEAQLAPHDHGGETGVWGTDSEATSVGSFNVMHGFESTGEIGDHSHSIPSDGEGAPMDNRPRWVGLVYICKVLYTTSI